MKKSANIIMAALITNRNKPKVMTVNGIVNTTSIGLTTILKIPKTAATIIADQKFLTNTPGKK